MKVIQVSTFFHPVTGGVEIQALEISKRLKEFGFDVEVYTTNSGRTGEKIIAKTSVVDGVKVTRFKTWLSISKLYKIAPMMLAGFLKSKPDIIHIHGFRRFEIYLALIAKRFTGCKVVVTTHNPFTTNIRFGLLELFVKIHDKTIGKWFSKYIDKVIALLPSEIEILNSQFKIPNSKIVVIPNGIDDVFYEKVEVEKKKWMEEEMPKYVSTEQELDFKKIAKKKWKGIVLSISRLNFVKGLQNLTTAVDKLRDTLFVFAGGDDGYEHKLRVLYRNNPNVIITGRYVTHDIARKFYAIADLFVLPSIHEPFGLAPLEALASGVPVIATTIGGPVQILNEKCARFIAPFDGSKWSDVLGGLLENNNELISMKIEGAKLAKNYRWKNVMEQIIVVYEQML